MKTKIKKEVFCNNCKFMGKHFYWRGAGRGYWALDTYAAFCHFKSTGKNPISGCPVYPDAQSKNKNCGCKDFVSGKPQKYGWKDSAIQNIGDLNDS